jgi:hypothetical protein
MLVWLRTVIPNVEFDSTGYELDVLLHYTARDIPRKNTSETRKCYENQRNYQQHSNG